MARARLHCIFVLLLYSQGSYGQQALGSNQNNAMNNANGCQQQCLQRSPRNFNQIPNGVINANLSQQPNSQQANLQSSSSMSGTNQGNMQQQLNLPPNLQSQPSSGPQNSFQITKIGFTPVTSGVVGNPSPSTQQLQNAGVNTNAQMNTGAQERGQMSNAPISISTLAELAFLKEQSPLLSFLNSQNNGQPQQNQQIVLNSQNQLTDAQKQFLVRSLQGQNQQGINVIQAQPRVVNVDNQQAITVRAVSQPQGQAIVTPLGNQPAYITVQAQPLATYLQQQAPQVIVEEEPSIMSLILSELGPQYAINAGYTPPKKDSKINLKTLIPLIINLIKEKNNCGCRNCGCPHNCQNNVCSSNMELEPQIAQIFGGYSNQKNYSQDTDDSLARIKKNDDDESTSNRKERKDDKKKIESVDSEEVSADEDNSEYIDEEDG